MWRPAPGPGVEQRLFQLLPAITCFPGVGLDIETSDLQPFRDLIGVTHRQCVDDAAALQRSKLLHQPCKAFGLAGETDGLQRKRGAIEIAPGDIEIGAEHRGEVFHDPVVRCRRSGEEPEIGRQCPDDALQQPVMGAEIVPPVGNAVRLVDDQQRDLRRDARQHLTAKALVRQALGRNQQDVDLPSGQFALDCRPVVHVVGVDRGGADAHPFRRSDLVSHQRQQRRDQERRTCAGFPQQLDCDEVDEALAPSGLLHDQQTAFAFDNVANGVFLAFAESGIGKLRPGPEKFQRRFFMEYHVSSPDLLSIK